MKTIEDLRFKAPKTINDLRGYQAPTDWLRTKEVPEVLAERETRGIGLGPMWDEPGDKRTMRERLGHKRKKLPTAADAAQAVTETPENLWIGTVGMSASVLEAIKREGMRYAGGGILPDEAVKQQFEAVRPPEQTTNFQDFKKGIAKIFDPEEQQELIDKWRHVFGDKDLTKGPLGLLAPEPGKLMPGAITAEAIGLTTRLPDVGAKIIRDYQQKKIKEQDQVTLDDAPITKLARSITQSGVPSMAVALGISILTGNSIAGMGILGMIAGGADFETQLQAGGSIRKSMIIGDLSAAAEIGGEMMVFPKFVKGLKTGIPLTQALTLIVENAGQEGATGFTQRFLEVFGTETTKGTDIADAARKAFDEGVKAVPENAWVGGATAGLVDLVSTGTGRILKGPDLKNKIEKKIGVSPKVAKRAVEMLEEGWTAGEIDRNLITPSKFLGDKAIEQLAAKEKPKTADDIRQEKDITELDRELAEIQQTPATVGIQAPDIAQERLLADKGAEIPSEAGKAKLPAKDKRGQAPAVKVAVKKGIPTREELYEIYEQRQAAEEKTDREILGDDLERYNRAQRRLGSMNDKAVERAEDVIEEIEAKLTKAEINKLYGIGEKGRTAEDLRTELNARDDVADALDEGNRDKALERLERFASDYEWARLALERIAQTKAQPPRQGTEQAPAAIERSQTIEDLREAISDEELSNITKPERRRLIKENAAKIEASDIYQNEVAGLDTAAREVGLGYYYINKGYRGEVEAIIGKQKGFPTAIQKMFTFNPTEKKIITLPDGTKAEVGPTNWESAVQEGLGRGKEGVEETWGEMDISEFVQRVVDSYRAQETIGGINKQALEAAEASGYPDLQLWAEKQRMFVEGASDQAINEMVSEWAAEWGIETEDVADEFVNEYGTKIRQIKKMEEPDEALEQLATEQIEAEDRQAAANSALEVLEANDIQAEVEQVEEISEDEVPFERRGKPVGAAITQGQKQVILLAYGADSETGYHEGYHILRRRLTEKSTKVLDKYFGDEEAEARAFAEYMKTGKTRTFLRGIWQKLRNVLRKVKSGLQGRGFKTAEDIFSGIRSGKIKKTTAKGGVQFETSGEQARREVDKRARIKARKARLAAQHKIKVKKPPKVSRARLKIQLQDYTPLLGKEYQEGAPRYPRKRGPLKIPIKDVTKPLREDLAPLPPGKPVMFSGPKLRRTMPVSDKPVPQDVLERNRQNRRIRDSIKEIKRQSVKVGEGVERAFNSISSRLFNINPELKRRIRDLEEVKLGRIARDLKDVNPLFKAFKKMKGKDWKDMDLFIKNGDVAGIEEMVKKYNLQALMEKFREVDDGIYDGANEVGMEVDHRKGHFHRRVRLPKELMAYIKKTYGNTVIMSRFEAALAKRKEQTGGRALTEEERAQVLNSVLRGYGGRHIWLSKPGGAKERSLFFIDDEINKFYYDSKKALEMYVRNMHEAIAEREFFGRETKQIQRLRATKARLATSLHKLQTKQGLRGAMTEPRYKEHISKRWAKLQEVTQQLEDLKHQDLTQTIGGYIVDLVNEGLITDPQQDKVQSILEAYFNLRPLSPRASFAKKIAYMTHIGTPIQTATQLKDYARILYRAPLQAPGATVRALVGKSKFSMEEHGLTEISVDMASVGGALNQNLRATGFRKLDGIMKEIYDDAVLTQFQQQAKRKRNLKEGSPFMERLQEVFGDKTQQVIRDLKAGKKTALTKKLAFNQILDMHPVARSEMTETYLKGGGITKYMYTLRTFGLKEFEYARNEIFRDMKKHPGRSVGRLVWLAFTVALAGAGVETLKDLMRGRKTKLPDKVADAWLNLIFMSRYGIDILRREGPGRGVARLVTPPTRHIDAPVRDLIKGEFSETPRNIPIGGEFYYWWFGEGRRREEERNNNSPVD